MALEDVYPDKPIPKPKINPALLTSNPAVFQRLSEDLKIIPGVPNYLFYFKIIVIVHCNYCYCSDFEQ
jgi:hypothetical protein